MVDDCGVCEGDGTSCSIVNFAVDMSATQYPNDQYDNVVVNGNWPTTTPEGDVITWSGWGAILTDEDGDSIYTGSKALAPNTSFEFVVAVTGSADGWSGWGVQFGQPGCNGNNFTVSTGEGGTAVDSRISVDELVADLCGVCDGDNSSCSDCAGTPNGDLVFDDCGVCGGDNSSCAVVHHLDQLQTNQLKSSILHQVQLEDSNLQYLV